MMGVVIGLTFMFGFGNVLDLALRLGVPAYVAPLVAPAVDLTVLGLLVGTRQLAVVGADDVVLRPARRLLLLVSVTTLALNVSEPLLAGQWAKAAFDAVGPLLLIGWAEVGPELLRALGGPTGMTAFRSSHTVGATVSLSEPSPRPSPFAVDEASPSDGPDVWLQRAREEDAQHLRLHQRHISAETLRKRLRIGAAKSRSLVAAVRAEAAR